MDHFEAQIILQFPLDFTPIESIDDAIRLARKNAEGIADSAEAEIIKVTVLHLPSGSGETVFIDA